MIKSLINLAALLALLTALTCQSFAQVPVAVPAVETLKQTAKRLCNDPVALKQFMETAYLQLGKQQQDQFMVELESQTKQPSKVAPRCERIAADDEPVVGVTIPPVTKVEGTWAGYVSTGFFSQYWAVSAGFPIYKKPVSQSEAGIVYTRGNREVGIVAWYSQGVTKCKWCRGALEGDLGGFVAWNLPGNRRVEVRDWHFFLDNAVSSDINNPSIKYSRKHMLSDTLTVTPFVKADAYFRTNSKGPKPGAIFTGGGTIEKVLGHGWSAVANLQVGYDPFGTFGFQKESVIHRQDYGLRYTYGSFRVDSVVTFSGATDPARPGKATFGVILTKNFSIGRQ